MWHFHLNKRKSSFPKDAFSQVWLKTALWFYERRFLNFRHFVIFFPWKMRGLHWNKLIYPSLKVVRAKFGWKLHTGSGENFFANFVNVFSLFCNHIPLEKWGALQLNNIIYPPPRDDLCQVWLILSQWFWRRRFLKLSMYFRYFVFISTWKRPESFIWIPIIQGCFAPSLVEIGPVVLENKMKMWKVYDNNDDDNDNDDYGGQR